MKKKNKIILSILFLALLLTVFLCSKANTSKKYYSPDKQYSVYAETYVYTELLCVFSYMDCWRSGKVYLYDEKENKVIAKAYTTSVEALETVNWIIHNNTVSFKSNTVEISSFFWILPRPYINNER